MSAEASLLPPATFRATPEDFFVEELPLYVPSGAGEHLYITFEKRGVTTLEAVEHLARALGRTPRDAGTAGLKDRHAVTVQVASFPLPLACELPPPATLETQGLRILALARHGNKLRTGHLRGNRFAIVLRDLSSEDMETVAARLKETGHSGVPNWFGPQRFGRNGDNATQARRWMRGEGPAPRHPRVRRLQFSALQAELFHHVLRQRVADGTWDRVIPGDLVRSVFAEAKEKQEQPVDEMSAEPERVATGPLFGTKMIWPTEDALKIEKDIISQHLGDDSLLRKWATLGEGARRPLKVTPRSLMVSRVEGSTNVLRVTFVLPRGAYATTVLGAACSLRDATQGPLSAAELEQNADHRFAQANELEEDTL